MAIGYGDTLGVSNLNNMLGANAVALQETCLNIDKFWSAVNNLGVEGLVAKGFSQADAQLFYDTSNYLQTVSRIYFGEAVQRDPYDFDSQLSVARAGQ